MSCLLVLHCCVTGCYRLSSVGCLSCVARCRCPLFVVRAVVLVVRCAVFVVRCLSRVVCRVWCVVRCLLFVVLRLLLAVRLKCLLHVDYCCCLLTAV